MFAAALLLLSAVASVLLMQRAARAVREYLSFAAALYAVLAIAIAQPFWPADGAALIVLALAPVSLALAASGVLATPAHPALSAAALTLALLCGLVAAFAAIVWLGLVPLVISLLAITAFALRAARERKIPVVHIVLGALALLAAAASMLAGGSDARTGLSLFTAAGLLGIALGLRAASGLRQKHGRGLGVAAIDLRR